MPRFFASFIFISLLDACEMLGGDAVCLHHRSPSLNISTIMNADAHATTKLRSMDFIHETFRSNIDGWFPFAVPYAYETVRASTISFFSCRFYRFVRRSGDCLTQSPHLLHSGWLRPNAKLLSCSKMIKKYIFLSIK